MNHRVYFIANTRLFKGFLIIWKKFTIMYFQANYESSRQKNKLISEFAIYHNARKFEQIHLWSDNKGYLKLLVVKVDKQLITKIIITYFSKILNRFKENWVNKWYNIFRNSFRG